METDFVDIARDATVIYHVRPKFCPHCTTRISSSSRESSLTKTIRTYIPRDLASSKTRGSPQTRFGSRTPRFDV